MLARPFFQDQNQYHHKMVLRHLETKTKPRGQHQMVNKVQHKVLVSVVQ